MKTSDYTTGGNDYDYMILSQAVKHPTLVLVRDLDKFDTVYRDEIDLFLRSQKYIQKEAADPFTVAYADATVCDREFFAHL